MKVYHTTKHEFVESILKNGLKINCPFNKSKNSRKYVEDVYGMNPIYVSLNPGKYVNGVMFEIEIPEDKLVADIPSLIEKDGNLCRSLGLIWYDNFKTNDNERFWSKITTPDNLVSLTKLLTPKTLEAVSSINFTKTATVLEDISPENIKIYGKITKKGYMIKELLIKLGNKI